MGIRTISVAIALASLAIFAAAQADTQTQATSPSVTATPSDEGPLALENKARAPGRAEYISNHPNLSPKIRNAILGGKVIPGMSPEEASAAGGNNIWATSGSELKQMTFNDLSQYGTSKPTGFVAVFDKGLVIRIDRLNDLDACQDEIAKGATVDWKDAKYPYAGFWMEKCEDGFGLRFFPGGGGRYSVRFCGPGGCGKGDPNDCTLIPDEPKYRVIDSNTVTIGSNFGPKTYKRCRP